jgi:hypothetical protein
MDCGGNIIPPSASTEGHFRGAEPYAVSIEFWEKAVTKKTSKTRRSTQYYHVADGEWIEVPKRKYREQCCDCGLIHRMNFRINAKGGIEIQAFRDARATNGARRYFAFTREE